MLIYCLKNQWITFKVTFVANSKLSALTYIPKDEQKQVAFSAYFDLFNVPNQRKLLFESNLPTAQLWCFF